MTARRFLSPPPLALAFAFCSFALLAPIVAGFDGKRVLQLLVLALPALLVLLYPAPTARGRRLQALLAGTYALLFITDGATRAYLLDLYAAAPNSALVLTAIANSNAAETLEYARTQAWPLGLAVAGTLTCIAALALGLVTAAPDDIDWDDEIRIAIEERAAMSPDALTGLEANLRFASQENMVTRIFGRLSAWQNWIFNRPNAVGEKGALKLYGTGQKAGFDFNRV